MPQKQATISSEQQTTPRTKNWWKRHTHLDIFKRIDMHDGAVEPCWEFKGFYEPRRWTRGRVRIGGVLYSVRKLVYSLWKDIPYDQVPNLTATCQNSKCVNPTHCVVRKGSKLL